VFYPKKNQPLYRELFQNPTAEYRGVPFWAWNGDLNKEELLRQLEVMKEMGMGGAQMHVRVGLEVPYLSEDFLDRVRSCVEKCRAEGMHAWLYDEDRWPSGTAGGLVTREETYRARTLLLTPEKRALPLIACFDVALNDDGTLRSYQAVNEGDVPAGKSWYAYLCVEAPSNWYNGQTYVNALDPAAIQKFLSVTHETYRKAVGKDFGGVIPAIFTDEPQLSLKKPLPSAFSEGEASIPWTEDLPQTYAAACGLDLVAHLPELFWDLPGGQPSAARYYYHDHVCQRFAEAYFDQYGAWCSRHGLLMTGHAVAEASLFGQTRYQGEVMRLYRSFHLPGIDMLRGNREFVTAKQAQSAVRQYGRWGMLSELYGVTGWDYDFRGHKFQGDWQAALGVTLRAHHLFWYTMKGEGKRDYPASLGYQSPWWREYHWVEDHFSRLSTVLTRGAPVVKVGVIHPIESYWLAFGPDAETLLRRRELDERCSKLTEWLLNGLIDFDFISESLLPELCPGGASPLTLGKMQYTTILVPGCQTLRKTTLDRLEAFADAGGRLIFLGAPPKYCQALPSERGQKLWQRSCHIEFSKAQLLEELLPERLVDVRYPGGRPVETLLHQLRCDGKDLWAFFAHSQEQTDKDAASFDDLTFMVRGEYYAEEFDTQTGETIPVATQRVDGKTVFQKRLYGYDSLLIRLTPDPVGEPPAAVCEKGEPLPVPALVDYTLDEPNALLLDKACFALDDEAYAPEQELLLADRELRRRLNWPIHSADMIQPWAKEEEGPSHRLRLRFSFESQVETSVQLALEDAPLARIRLNGNAVTAEPQGWFVDKSIGIVHLGLAKTGTNTVEVELPFSRRSYVEWCWLLGDFGVSAQGEHRVLVEKPVRLGFDDITRQFLPYYTGNVTWHIPVKAKKGELLISVPHYAGAAVKVSCGKADRVVIYPPYCCRIPVSEGEQTVHITLLGNRFNAFGHLHCASLRETWVSEKVWRYPNWTDSYRLRPLGILSAPQILQLSEP